MTTLVHLHELLMLSTEPSRRVDYLLYMWFAPGREQYAYRDSRSRGWLRISKSFPDAQQLMDACAPRYTSEIGAALSLQAIDQRLQITSSGKGSAWTVLSLACPGAFKEESTGSHVVSGMFLPNLLCLTRVVHEMMLLHPTSAPEIVGGSKVHG